MSRKISNLLRYSALLAFIVFEYVFLSYIRHTLYFSTKSTSRTNDLSRSTVFEILGRTGVKIKELIRDTSRKCELKQFGQFGPKTTDAWGTHSLCNMPPKRPCIFYSFGISSDYQFDTDIANIWQCQGLAFDPSVVHKSQLHPNVTFHMIAAKTLSDQDDRQWSLVATVPALKKCFKHERISVLKMDCEGCEYSLARDVEDEMPSFFADIDQVALEIHVSKFWIKTWSHIMNLAKLFALLEKNNLQLVDSRLTGCSPDHEKFGCPSILLKSGYPCGNETMCQNLLFARI